MYGMRRLKRIIGAVIVIALLTVSTLLPEAVASVYGAEPKSTSVPDEIIRVHLTSYGAPSSITMSMTGKHSIKENGVSVSGSVTARISSGAIEITAGGKTYRPGKDVTLLSASGSVKNLIRINKGYSYAGDIRLIVKSGGIKIVNNVDYETYVMGVLPYEVGEGWPAEAQKAQAIASRTYAYFIANSRSRVGQEHDIVNTTMAQVYRGYDATKVNSISAVNATTRQILNTSSGTSVLAVYSASNGGNTELPRNAGASLTNFDYLPYKSDNWDLKYALATSAYSAQIKIPKKIKVADLINSASQPYPMLRNALVSIGVDPSAITGTVEVSAIKLTNPRYSTPKPHCFTGADITFSYTLKNSKTKISATVCFRGFKDGSGILRPFLNKILLPLSSSKFSSLYLKSNSSHFLLASVRYGHSAGMSQIGAYQMAREGKKANDILAFYYLMGSKTKLQTKKWNIKNDVSPAKPTNPLTVTKKDPPPPVATTVSAVKGKVTVTSGTLNMRSGAGTSYDIIASLKKGSAVTILATKGDWYKVKSGSLTGYVKKEFIKIIKS